MATKKVKDMNPDFLKRYAANSAASCDREINNFLRLEAEIKALESEVARLRTPKDATEAQRAELVERRRVLNADKSALIRQSNNSREKAIALEKSADGYADLYKYMTGETFDVERKTDRIVAYKPLTKKRSLEILLMLWPDTDAGKVKFKVAPLPEEGEEVAVKAAKVKKAEPKKVETRKMAVKKELAKRAAEKEAVAAVKPVKKEKKECKGHGAVVGAVFLHIFSSVLVLIIALITALCVILFTSFLSEYVNKDSVELVNVKVERGADLQAIGRDVVRSYYENDSVRRWSLLGGLKQNIKELNIKVQWPEEGIAEYEIVEVTEPEEIPVVTVPEPEPEPEPIAVPQAPTVELL